MVLIGYKNVSRQIKTILLIYYFQFKFYFYLQVPILKI